MHSNRSMRLMPLDSARAAALLGALLGLAPAVRAEGSATRADITVAPQYSSAHVYVAPAAFDRFVASVLATFGGAKSPKAVLQVTPTASQADWQAVTTPVGLWSVFAFKTPIPYPFGLERTGYLVSDLDVALEAARQDGAAVQVA